MEKVEIIKMGINGEGIAYVNHKPVFIKGAFPKETAEIEITEENDRYTKAAATKIVKESEERRKPLCSHADSCGACALSAMDHKAQCHWKKELLVEALEKSAGTLRNSGRMRNEPAGKKTESDCQGAGGLCQVTRRGWRFTLTLLCSPSAGSASSTVARRSVFLRAAR